MTASRARRRQGTGPSSWRHSNFANAAAKLVAKRVDLMVGNDVRSGDSGFEVDTNRAVLLDAHGCVDETGLVTKVALADLVLDRIRDARRPHEGATP